MLSVYQCPNIPTNLCHNACRSNYNALDLANVLVLIIDEISTCSSQQLLNIHRRACEIWASDSNALFGNRVVVIAGDIAQLPPVAARQAHLSSPVTFTFSVTCSTLCP